jgi:hypothetical protein
MKQTAVEWLVEQLISKAMATYDTTTYNAIEQAKQKEKEQIMNAYVEGCFDNIFDETTDKIRAEDYYSQTYN